MRTIAIVTDENVDGYYGDIVENTLKEEGFFVVKLVLPAGEKTKTMDSAMFFI